MGLKAAICTQCGAQIEVDETKEAGICPSCGTAFVTEKVINKYITNVTNNNDFSGANISVVGGNIDNLIKMGENALNAGNGKEAVDYANKALEINTESSEAWTIKMKAIEHIGTIGNPKVTEAISYGENAIKYADDKEAKTKEVYEYYINRAITIMAIALGKTKDVTQLKSVVSISMTGAQKGDQTARDLYAKLISAALLLKLKIPNDYIANNPSMQEKVLKLAELYVDYCSADVERLKLYGSKLLPEALTARETTLKTFKSGLPSQVSDKIDNSSVQKNNSGGCYVATCVYGSYDCPQVWTLRRYRDYKLARTWYGRAFIKIYYTISPHIVKIFGNYGWFKMIWRTKLDKMVDKLKRKGFKDTAYQDKEW